MAYLDQRTVTPARLAANRAAAQKSTGPKTPEGRDRSAFNSFKHGGFAFQRRILREALARSGYDASQFDHRRSALFHDWQPIGPQQQILVDDLAWLYWLRDQARLALVESEARQPHPAELNHREQQKMEIRQREDPGRPELRPLSDTWQQMVANIEKLDRQINAKIGLLLRLKKRDALVPDFHPALGGNRAAAPPSSSNRGQTMAPPAAPVHTPVPASSSR